MSELLGKLHRNPDLPQGAVRRAFGALKDGLRTYFWANALYGHHEIYMTPDLKGVVERAGQEASEEVAVHILERRLDAAQRRAARQARRAQRR